MMNREEMLERIAKWWEWPTVPTQRLSKEPGGWDWIVVDGTYVLTHSIHDPITRADWRDARNGVGGVCTPSVEPARLTAPDFLERGAQHMRDRAAQRDKPNGERSMARAVAAFNAQEGTNLTEEQGWRFMVQLKYSRACAGVFVADDYEDMAAYAGLAGEAAQ